jgi:hypothetical protein
VNTCPSGIGSPGCLRHHWATWWGTSAILILTMNLSQPI